MKASLILEALVRVYCILLWILRGGVGNARHSPPFVRITRRGHQYKTPPSPPPQLATARTPEERERHEGRSKGPCHFRKVQ